MTKVWSMALAFLALLGCRVRDGAQPEAVGLTSELDYGFRFYGKHLEYQRVEPGKVNPFYDNTRKTIMLTHGYHKNHFQKIGQEFFSYRDPDTRMPINLIDPLIDSGYNVMVFDWQQFSDEDKVTTSEDKIWQTDKNGRVRWRRPDGTYTTEGSPNLPIADLLVRDYVEIMKDYAGDNVRFVAMSLGGQLVARSAQLLQGKAELGQISRRLVPKRVAMLDPYFTNKPFGGKWRGGSVVDIVQDLRNKGMIFETTKTSGFLFNGLIGDINLPLVQAIGRMEYDLAFINSKNMLDDTKAKHTASEFIYMLGFGQDVPKACMNGICTTLTSAAASDEEARAFMNAAQTYKQEQPMINIHDGFGNFVVSPQVGGDVSPTADTTQRPQDEGVDAVDAAADDADSTTKDKVPSASAPTRR